MMSRKSLSDDTMFLREDKFTKIVKEWLDVQPDVSYYKASDRYQSGISDIIACVSGIFVAIELKAEYYEATATQRAFIRDIQRAGGVAGDAYTMGKVKALVNIAREMAKKLR